MTVRVCLSRNGAMMVEDHDEYVGRSFIALGEFGEAQLELFRSMVTPDMVVVDVGANIGAFTVELAKIARYVHAFEPQRHVYHMLCGNVALRNLDNVTCHHMALGDTSGILEVPTLNRDVVNNLGAFSVDMPGEKADRVRIEPLQIPCQFLKVDVEGHELAVLRGAEPMIRECRPVLYVENDRHDKADALIEYVRELGYTPYWHVTPMFRENNFRRLKADPWHACHSFDMLCIEGKLDDPDAREARVGDFAKMLPKEEHAAAA